MQEFCSLSRDQHRFLVDHQPQNFKIGIIQIYNESNAHMPYLGSQHPYEKTHGADVIPMGGTGTDKSCHSIETGHRGWYPWCINL